MGETPDSMHVQNSRLHLMTDEYAYPYEYREEAPGKLAQSMHTI
jgi:hypothetical protein